ncbi:MAG: cardiolipin synthase [Defluviitaleaceae bacterium]|nr:cardiolipin synthase [Defluviitaleaceae bacterium]
MFETFTDILFAALTGVGATLVIHIVFVTVVVFYERKDPSVTWAWLMLVLLAPYIGFILYLLFGLENKKVRVFAHKARSDEALFSEYCDRYGMGEHPINDSLKTLTGTTHFDDILYLNLVSGHGLITDNNRAEVFHEGAGKFDALIADINNAKSFVHLEYYILKPDALGKRVVDALATKAAEGVEVRLLLDGMGCARTPRKFFAPLLKNGGKLGIHMPRQLVRINFRNHRKLAVIDGIIAYNGGLNIGDEYLGAVARFGYWRDCHLRITGEAARHFELRFIMDWNFSSTDKIELDSRYFPGIHEPCGNIKMQVVSSGPDTKWNSIAYALAKMINEADRSIYIQTPYFVPDDNIQGALRIAALSGKDVRIIIPGKPDHPFVYGAGMSYLGELIPAGVKCYRYENGFVHGKLMIIDGQIATVGTANMDIRSFKLNFETNTFVYCEETASKLTAQFIADLDDCTEMDAEFYKNRPRWEKISESVSRLFSPLL